MIDLSSIWRQETIDARKAHLLNAEAKRNRKLQEDLNKKSQPIIKKPVKKPTRRVTAKKK